MKDQRERVMRTAALVCACCLACAAGSCGYGGRAWAAEIETQERPKVIEYTSELYDSREQIPAPEPVRADEAGEPYDLSYQAAEPVPVTGRKKILDGEILYQGVDREAKIPETAVFDVTDEESKRTFTAELPLYNTEYENERWEDLLQFTVTFHEYGADSYVLGDGTIINPEMLMGDWTEERTEGRKEERKEGGGQLEPEACREELLKLIGMTRETCRMERCQWTGEPYQDEAGILCRDAVVVGKLRVYDCRATYRGETRLPDYERWRLHAVYTARETERAEETAVDSEVAEGLPESEAVPSPAAKPGRSLWDKIGRAVRICVELTVGILFILLLAGIFRVLVRMAKKLDRQWRDSDERRKP